jgi:hypothetical protein
MPQTSSRKDPEKTTTLAPTIVKKGLPGSNRTRIFISSVLPVSLLSQGFGSGSEWLDISFE